MTEVLLIKAADGSLRPYDDTSWAVTNGLPVGEKFVADVRSPKLRSNRQHAMYFALLHEMFANQEYYKDFNHYRAMLLIHMGRCSWYKDREGKELPVADSLAFGKMSSEEFNALVESTLDFAERAGWDRQALLAKTDESARLRR